MSGQACRVCGAPLVIPPTGRRPKYCGTPCRQRAARARDAAARAASEASWAREQLAETMHRASVLGGRLAAAYGSVPRPAGSDADGALLAAAPPWEGDVIRAARELEREVHRAAGLAEAHHRAAVACRAARATGFRRAPTPDFIDDETAGAGSVAWPSPATAATKPASQALRAAAGEVVMAANPSTAAGSGLPDEIAEGVEDLAEFLDGGLDALLTPAARSLLGWVRAGIWPPGVQARVDELAPAWDTLARALDAA